MPKTESEASPRLAPALLFIILGVVEYFNFFSHPATRSERSMGIAAVLIGVSLLFGAPKLTSGREIARFLVIAFAFMALGYSWATI